MTDNLDLMVWTAGRQTFVDGMVAYGFATIDPESGNLVPRDEVVIDEIGAIDRREYDEDMTVIGGHLIEGHHVNIRVWGAFAAEVTGGLPQEGSIFERTHILSMIPGLEWQPITEQGVQAGYVGPMGVRLYDPASVTLPARVWG